MTTDASLTPQASGPRRSTMPREVARRRRGGGGSGGGAGGRGWHPMLGAGLLPRVLSVLALILMAGVWLVPLAWGVNTSFKSEVDASAAGGDWIPAGGFTLAAYREIFAQGNLPVWALNSLLIGVAVTVLTVVVSAMAAYALSRGLFRGRRALLAVTVASIMVPPQILIVPLFRQMLVMNLVDTYAAVILPQVVAPVMVFILKKFFDAVPRELEEAARIDGAGSVRIFVSVILPLSRPILAAVSIFVFITTWNNFLWPFIITSDPTLMTLPVGLSSVKDSYGLQNAQASAASVLAAVPLLVVFMLFQRQIVKSVATTGLGGQ
ncbi:carbohydrate ABC transporter permease [Streptomyces niveus]|uniref:Carbohydrate ABC transporter permease n=1 Tax=Streptomyces niveus TaxID=193462 RepID=A0ABZ1ZUY0_STRNV|nr:carbohydrate ABC transporter permease [Streptomyces niveus]